MHIQIAGPDGAGKSTLAKNLCQLFYLEQYAFATSLREHCIEQGLLSREQAYNKPTPPEVRSLLRSESKRMKELHGNDIWVLRTRQAIAGKFNWVCDDLRYLAEIEPKAVLIYLDGEIPAELADEPSFRELPAIKERAHFVLPARPAPSQCISMCLALADYF